MPHRLSSRRPTPIVLAVTDFAIGFVLIIEPAPRASAASFHAPRQLMPLPAWGVVLLVLACAITVRWVINRHAGHTLSLAGGWHAFFVVALIGSAVQIETAGLIGIFAFGCLMVMHLLAAWRKVW